MTQSKEEALFDAGDVDLLAQAVSIFPNLEFACYATKVARKRLKFPVRDQSEIVGLLSKNKLPERIAGRRIGKREIEKFFPKEYFPIEDERDFLGKVLGALSYGDVMHHHERFLKDPAKYSPVPYRKEK
jgi:hypothetical protein